MSAEMPPLLSTFQAAEYLGVPRQTLANWRTRERRGPAFVRLGRRIMYRRADVDAWIDARRTAPEEQS